MAIYITKCKNCHSLYIQYFNYFVLLKQAFGFNKSDFRYNTRRVIQLHNCILISIATFEPIFCIYSLAERILMRRFSIQHKIQ